MKFHSLVLLLFCTTLITNTEAQPQSQSIAQSQTTSAGHSLIKNKCAEVHISLSTKQKDPGFPTIFNNIQVLDVRSDTSRIGLISPSTYLQEEMLFHNSAASTMTSYLNFNYANPKGRDSLLVVIKELWISTPMERHTFESIGKNRVSWKRLCNISFRFEGYQKTSEGYVPLTYLDTLCKTSMDWIVPKYIAESNLPQLIAHFMNQVASIRLNTAVGKKRTVSCNEIDSFNRVRFDYPMDTATRLVKGVYANIDEFRNNQPSITQYQLSKDKQSNIELQLQDQDGKLYYNHTMWGFSDGNQCYVMMDGNLFPLFYIHHQFYVLGSKQYNTRSIPVVFIIPLTSAAFLYGLTSVDRTVLRKLSIYRLDVQSGKVID